MRGASPSGSAAARDARLRSMPLAASCPADVARSAADVRYRCNSSCAGVIDVMWGIVKQSLHECPQRVQL